MIDSRNCFAILALVVCFTTVAIADESDMLLSPQSVELQRSTGAQSVSISDQPANYPSTNPLPRVVSSLAIVLGGFFLVAVLLRKPQQEAKSTQLIETLGAVSVAPKVKLHLVRLGSRLLVLHLAPNAVHCVTEITDADEVQRLLVGNDRAATLSPRVSELLNSSADWPSDSRAGALK